MPINRAAINQFIRSIRHPILTGRMLDKLALANVELRVERNNALALIEALTAGKQETIRVAHFLTNYTDTTLN